jgi:putative membrane protein
LDQRGYDQQLAGGILWAGGEFVAVGMLGALVFQWMRQSEREARRIDRALDRAEAEQEALLAEQEALHAGATDQAVRSARSYEAETHR